MARREVRAMDYGNIYPGYTDTITFRIVNPCSVFPQCCPVAPLLPNNLICVSPPKLD